jgi:hypothetical protein
MIGGYAWVWRGGDTNTDMAQREPQTLTEQTRDGGASHLELQPALCKPCENPEIGIQCIMLYFTLLYSYLLPGEAPIRYRGPIGASGK